MVLSPRWCCPRSCPPKDSFCEGNKGRKYILESQILYSRRQMRGAINRNDEGSQVTLIALWNEWENIGFIYGMNRSEHVRGAPPASGMRIRQLARPGVSTIGRSPKALILFFIDVVGVRQLAIVFNVCLGVLTGRRHDESVMLHPYPFSYANLDWHALWNSIHRWTRGWRPPI